MKRIVLCMIITFCGAAAFSQPVKPVTASQLEARFRAGKDTLYVVNFWATWCVPCVKELPAFEKLQDGKSGQPFKLLLVSMDFESKLKSAVVPFVKKHKLTAEVLLASRKHEQEFVDAIDREWSGSLPGTLVVNTSKNVRKFYEKAFTPEELNVLYQTYK